MYLERKQLKWDLEVRTLVKNQTIILTNLSTSWAKMISLPDSYMGH